MLMFIHFLQIRLECFLMKRVFKKNIFGFLESIIRRPFYRLDHVYLQYAIIDIKCQTLCRHKYQKKGNCVMWTAYMEILLRLLVQAILAL